MTDSEFTGLLRKWSDFDPNDGLEDVRPKKGDFLLAMFEQQSQFMQLLEEKRSFPKWPVDLTSKVGQQTCRDASLGGIEEWFEALKHLKNWKSHRATEVKDVDRAEFLEEMSDALHYFVEVILLADISPEELFDAYMKKGATNVARINGGY